ncbi:MAG: MFS transporter [Dethiobacteraceae bacterium]|jgi:OFA family oxalate/formate antiporter-like MFS transporter|nr:MFS transporter [Bacillota bacterium]
MSLLTYGVGESKRWYYPISAFLISALRIAPWALFYPHVQTAFNLDTTASIILISTFTGLGSMIIGPPISGAILDKYGPKIPFVLSGIFALSGYLILMVVLGKETWAEAQTLWYVGGFLIGLGAGFYSGSYTATVAKWFPDRLGTAMAVGGSGMSIGTMILTPLIASFIVQYGFTGNIFLILGVVGFCAITLLGVIAWRLPAADWKPQGMVVKARAAGQPVQEQKQYTFAEAIRDKRYWILAGGFLGAAFSNMLFSQNATLIIIEGLTSVGMDRAEIMATVVPYYLSLTSFAGIFGTFFWGWVLDKLGPFVALPLMYFISGVLIWVFYMGYTSVTLIYILGAILVLAMRGEGTLHYASVPAVFGRQHIGKIMSTLNSMSVGIGIAFGPFLGSYIKDITGGFKASLILAVSLRMMGTAFAIIGYFLTKKEKEQAKSEAAA